MLTYLIITGQICLDYSNTALCDRSYQQRTADQVLILTGECRPITGEFHPHWSHHGHSRALRVIEEPVPVRQQSVARDDGRTDCGEVCQRQQPRLPPSRVHVRMSSEERLKRPSLQNHKTSSNKPYKSIQLQALFTDLSMCRQPPLPSSQVTSRCRNISRSVNIKQRL